MEIITHAIRAQTMTSRPGIAPLTLTADGSPLRVPLCSIRVPLRYRSCSIRVPKSPDLTRVPATKLNTMEHNGTQESEMAEFLGRLGSGRAPVRTGEMMAPRQNTGPSHCLSLENMLGAAGPVHSGSGLARSAAIPGAAIN